MNRFAIAHRQHEWVLTYSGLRLAAFASREEAEAAAWLSAEGLAMSGQAVSILIMPEDMPNPEEPSITEDASL